MYTTRAIGRPSTRPGGTRCSHRHGLGHAPRIERQRLTILVADVVGFSRLVELDALATALDLRALRRRFVLPTVLAHRGRLVSSAGDGALIAFPRPVDAVNCAVALQRGVNTEQTGAGIDPGLRLHMGISTGESIAVDGELFGHPLNVAARLQALAEPGDVYLSETVVAEVTDTGIGFEALGQCLLRNMAQPIGVYRIARSTLAG
ncbi:adenylate/guanylate cyclase domain-containing protein [Inquilinus sp. Marseille-Q2685]|uniref:adenylate/guanylate cyclase domain-containing protein n=1 Tax=Inquilinus sp. Marseille-Q2685 TaxID=2866581 RepID=UPI001CE4B074|nr:adenylate/guanylate cyclase domain-containing protein [Inquilinus sp. Marseille-Q2685]